MNNLPPPSFLSGYGSVMAGNFIGNVVNQQDYKIQDVHYITGAVFTYLWNMFTGSSYSPAFLQSPMAFYLVTFGTGLSYGYVSPTSF